MRPHDVDGQPIRLGDRVLVLAVPTSIAGLDETAKTAFSRAVGRTIQVCGFGEDGSVELEMIPPRFRRWDTIWIEPQLVRRIMWSPSRRRCGPSNAFKERRVKHARR
jgi:hypothetical protein